MGMVETQFVAQPGDSMVRDLGQRVPGFSRHADPDQSGRLRRVVAGEPGSWRDACAEAGRDLGALAIRRVLPTVIGTTKRVVLHPVERQGRTPVHAQVPEGAHFAVQPDNDERLAEKGLAEGAQVSRSDR